MQNNNIVSLLPNLIVKFVPTEWLVISFFRNNQVTIPLSIDLHIRTQIHKFMFLKPKIYYKKHTKLKKLQKEIS